MPRSVLILVVLVVSGGSVRAEDWSATGAEIVALVRDQFMDPARGAGWAQAHAGYAAEVRDQASFAAATRQALGRLATSHTGYYTPRSKKGTEIIF